MKIPIVFPTYKRPDGQSEFYIRRLLDSIYNQTHQDFVVYMIGDRYEDKQEFNAIVDSYDERLKATNLPVAMERDNYSDKTSLWHYGGVNAINTGIQQAISDGFSYIALTNHDDFYEVQYLEHVNNCITATNAAFIYTKAIYINKQPFPNITDNSALYYISYPQYAHMILSTVCMNFSELPFMFRDLHALGIDTNMPSDGDMWERVRPYMIKNNLISILINRTLVHHPEEQYTLHNFEFIINQRKNKTNIYT